MYLLKILKIVWVFLIFQSVFPQKISKRKIFSQKMATVINQMLILFIVSLNVQTACMKLFQEMERPYFHRINLDQMQKLSDVQDFSERITWSTQGGPEGFGVIEEEVPDEGKTHPIKIETYKSANKHEKEEISDEQINQLDRIITIKMPKTLMVKQFNVESYSKKIMPKGTHKNHQPLPYSLPIKQIFIADQNLTHEETEAYDDQELIDCEGQIMEQQTLGTKINIPNKIFQTHSNIFQSYFSAPIYLPLSDQFCFCHLSNSALRIVTNQSQSEQKKIIKDEEKGKERCIPVPKKIKYFVDLKKYKMKVFDIKKQVHEATQAYQNQDQSCLRIQLISKRQKQSFFIKFRDIGQKNAFQCVHLYNQDTWNSLKVKKDKDLLKKDEILQGKYLCGQFDNIENNSGEVNSPRLSRQASIDSLKFTVERVRFMDAFTMIETFDIILFKSKNIMSKMQRFFTNSDYDHVALLMKAYTGDILMLEATGNNGVAVYSFQSLRMTFEKKYYQRIAIRKLIEPSNLISSSKLSRIHKLQNFVKEVNGKQYKFDPMYLFSSSTETKNFQTEDKTFFCSSLVAQALKVCGILGNSKPCYKYLPKHFADIDGLNELIKSGMYYSDLIIIEK